MYINEVLIFQILVIVDEHVLEKREVAEASRAVVRAGFWKLMDKIAGKEEDLVMSALRTTSC